MPISSGIESKKPIIIYSSTVASSLLWSIGKLLYEVHLGSPLDSMLFVCLAPDHCSLPRLSHVLANPPFQTFLDWKCKQLIPANADFDSCETSSYYFHPRQLLVQRNSHICSLLCRAELKPTCILHVQGERCCCRKIELLFLYAQ